MVGAGVLHATPLFSFGPCESIGVKSRVVPFNLAPECPRRVARAATREGFS
jgi:hypothetical protein